MKEIAVTINGTRVEALVEPRTHLADFLREQQRLTGTHLGCEQGVCGACTILFNGAPARACLTLAVGCDGADIRTVEGFAGDPVMARLREAFSAEHALQCGFCTPGMLISSYDIVRRLPQADEARIRSELSGNLCRCTGYMGIVAAVKSVLAEGPAAHDRPAPVRRRALETFTTANAATPAPTAAPAPERAPPGERALEPGWTRLAESFDVDRPPDEVWALLGDVPRVASCLPGAVLEGSDGGILKGRMQVRLGPISAAFAGTATHERDAAARVGILAGNGADQRGNSRVRGRVAYRLVAENDGRTTRVALTLDFLLQGMLAQFSRSGLVKDLVGRMVRDFAANLAAQLASGSAAVAAPAAPPLRAGSLLWRVIWARFKALFSRALR
jgi:aerobic carbon-monoxide dehydrogenase small subunit